MCSKQNILYYKLTFLFTIVQPMMDAETSMKNQSQFIQELSKQQQHIDDNDIKDQQTANKTIKKYQQKINDMLRVMKTQKSQNQHLKTQLKTLNDHLNSVIAKLNHKNISKSPDNNKDDAIKKQLDNQIKKNVNLQKQLQTLRIKVKSMDAQKIQQMQSELKQKDKKIQELNQSVKMYEKIEKQQKNSDTYKKQQELLNKISSLNQQVLHLKSKLAKQKKQQQMQQKMMKRQHQQILNLQAKTKNADLNINDVKEKRQQSAQKTLPKSDSSSKVGYLKDKYNTVDFSKPENDKNIKTKSKRSDKQLAQQKIKQLQQRCQTLQVTKKAAQRHFRHQIQTLKAKIKSLQSQLNENKNSLKRKDQQANILLSKMKETQRKNYNTLQPIQKLKYSQDFASGSLFDQRKQFRGLIQVQGNYRKFDDTEGLSLQKNYRIKSFTFTWFEQHILSLDTVYELRDGTQKQISSFKISHQYKNIKSGSLQLNDFQYIKQIELYCSKFIQFMRIQTSRDKVLEVGNQKNKIKCKQFQFDVRTNEKPIAFLGAIQTKKIIGSQGNKQLLISFGLQIKKKQVVGKSRYNPARTTSLVKKSSKSVLDEGSRNDKNIIEEE